MNKQKLLCIAGLFLAIAASGCTVRTYSVTKDRVDQGIKEGNRGYLMGEAAGESRARKTTRTVQIVEVELNTPLKFQGPPKCKKAFPGQKTEEPYDLEEVTQGQASGITKFEKYTVQKNDTLQKISQKFYGTAKKWVKIYNANKNILKGPDKVYPGQELKIPIEEDKEAPENLK